MANICDTQEVVANVKSCLMRKGEQYSSVELLNQIKPCLATGLTLRNPLIQNYT